MHFRLKERIHKGQRCLDSPDMVQADISEMIIYNTLKLDLLKQVSELGSLQCVYMYHIIILHSTWNLMCINLPIIQGSVNKATKLITINMTLCLCERMCKAPTKEGRFEHWAVSQGARGLVLNAQMAPTKHIGCWNVTQKYQILHKISVWAFSENHKPFSVLFSGVICLTWKLVCFCSCKS